MKDKQTIIIKPIGSLQPAMETTVSEDYIHYGDSHKMLYTCTAKSQLLSSAATVESIVLPNKPTCREQQRQVLH